VTSWVTHNIGEVVAAAQFTTEIVKSLVAAELEVAADPHNIMAARDIQAVNTVTVLAEAWH
jgi:ADP-ribosylglycohydrolase